MCMCVYIMHYVSTMTTHRYILENSGYNIILYILNDVIEWKIMLGLPTEITYRNIANIFEYIDKKLYLVLR